MYMYKVIFTDGTSCRVHGNSPRQAWKIAEKMHQKEAMRIEYRGKF